MIRMRSHRGAGVHDRTDGIAARRNAIAGVGPDLTLALDCDQSVAGVQASCGQVVGQPHDRRRAHKQRRCLDIRPLVCVRGSRSGHHACNRSRPTLVQRQVDSARVATLISTTATWEAAGTAPPAPDEDTGEDGPGTAFPIHVACSAISVSASRRWPPGISATRDCSVHNTHQCRNWYNRVVVRRCPDQGPGVCRDRQL